MAKDKTPPDVRTLLPAGMSHIDMNANGDRRGPLEIYGWPKATTRSILERVFAAWGVKDTYLINPTDITHSPVPEITRDGGPRYMLLFADGFWREATFGGINGPAWFYCPYAGGVKARNGEAAWLMVWLASKLKQQATLKLDLSCAAVEVLELQKKLGLDPKPRTLAELAKEALAIQDASNLCGIVVACGRVLKELGQRLELDGLPRDTSHKNNHPIAKLWASKIHSLAGMDCDTTARFTYAYETALQLSKGDNSAETKGSGN